MPLDYNQFAEKIKAKYPEYKDVDNLELTKKMIAKYPEYKNQVTLDVPKKKKSTSKGSQFYSKALEEVGLSAIDRPEKQKASVFSPSNIKELAKSDEQKFTETQSKLKSDINRLEVEQELSDAEMAQILKWSEEDVKRAKQGVPSKNVVAKPANVDPKSVDRYNDMLSSKVGITSNQLKAVNDVESNKTNDLKSRVKYYDNVDTQERLKNKGYDIDVNGNLDDEKTKSALTKENAKWKTYKIEQDKKNEIFDKIDDNIDAYLVSNTEEYVVDELRKKFSGSGFIFEESGMGNYLTVKFTPDGSSTTKEIEIPLAGISSSLSLAKEGGYNEAGKISEENAKKLKDFMKGAYITKSEWKSFSPTDTEAGSDAYEESNNLTWMLRATELMAKNPAKYGKQLIGDDVGTNILNKASYAVKNEYKWLEGEYSDLKKKIDAYNQNPTDAERVAINNKLHELSVKEYNLNEKANNISKADKYWGQSAAAYAIEQSKKGNFLGQLGAQFASGFGSMGKATANIGMDFAVALAPAETLTDPITYQRYKDDGLSDDEIKETVLKDAKRTFLPALENAYYRIGSGGSTTKEYIQSEDRGVMENVLGSLAESLGTALSGGGNSAMQRLAFFAQSYNSMSEQMRGKEFDGISESDKMLISVPFGLAVGALEKFGYDASMGISKSGIFNKTVNNVLRKSLTDLPKDATVNEIKREINKNVSNLVKSGAIKIVAGSITEGNVEGLQNLTETGTKFIVNEIYDKELFQNVPDITTKDGIMEAVSMASEDAALGALGGLIMSGGSISTQTYKQAKFNETSDYNFDLFYGTMMDDNLRNAVKYNTKIKLKNGEITESEAKEEIESIERNTGILRSIPADLSLRDKKDSFNLIIERNKLEQEIDGKDAALIVKQKARIAEINSELNKISENATKENNVEQQKDTTEGSKVEYQGAVKGQQEVGTTEGTVGQTTQQKTDTGDSTFASEEAKQEVSTYIAELGSNERVGGTIDSVMAKINNAEYINDSEINSTIDTIFNEVESINNDANYSDQTKKALSDKLMNIAEQLDNYEFRTKTETVAVTQRGTTTSTEQAPTKKVSAEKFFEGQQAEVNGMPATFKSNKGRTEAVMENGDTVILDTPTMIINEGDFEFDDAGALTAVTVTDRFGTTAKFTGDTAMDLAIKQRENQIGTVEQAEFETVYKEVETKYVKETPKKKEASNDEKVKTLRAEEQVELTNAIPNIEEYRVDGEINKESMPADVRAKYDEIYERYDKQITPLLEAQAIEQQPASQTTEQPIAEVKTVEQEIEELGQLISGSDVEIDNAANAISNKKMSKVVAKAAKSIARVTPGVKFKVYEDDASYRRAVDETTEGTSSSGTFDPATNTVHINLTNANNRTVAHEVFHTVLLNKVRTNNDAAVVTNKMIEAISSKLEGMPDVKKKLDDFASNYDENIQNEEKLSELVGILAENYMNSPASIKDIIARWIDRLAKMFGLDPFQRNEVYDMLNTIARKTAKGKTIKEKDIKLIPKGDTIEEMNKRFQADFSDSVSKLTFVFDKNGGKFKKLEDDGYITKDKSLSDFNGKYVFLHQPDAAFSGMIYKDGEVLVEGKGGVFYPIKFHEDGYFWASTSTTAIKMADDLNKVMEQNEGTIYMALTSAPNNKLMSSTTMSNAVLDFFSSKALDKNFKINPNQLKLSLIKAANDVKFKKTKNKTTGVVTEKPFGLRLKLTPKLTIEEIQSAIRTKLASDKSSFEDRKNFAIELTKLMATEINKNDVAVNQFGKLFSEGIQNKYFKGITKTGKLKISAANMTQALSEMFTEPMLKEGVDRDKGGQVYAILELNGAVKPFKTDQHESYPMAIKSDSDSKVKLNILKDRQNWYDVFEDFETNEIVASKERQSKIYPTSGVSVRGLRVNTSKIEGKPTTEKLATPRNQKTAPNGKPSNLNDTQWEQVRTPAFKKWFGDWENDPDNASKVVDENGEPLVVYHGGKIFNVFNKGVGNDKGIYFTNNKFFATDIFALNIELAERDKRDFEYKDVPEEMLESMEWDEKYFKYSKVYEVFLNIRNPKVYDSLDAKLIPKTYSDDIDGVIVDSTGDFGYKGNQIVVFEPNQIKLADGTNKVFDGLNADIRKQKTTKVYNASPKEVSELGKRSGVVYFATDKREADAYASMNRGEVREFDMPTSLIKDEKVVKDKIKELGLQPKDADYTIDESSVYELIDDRFDNSLSPQDIKKLFSALKKDGVKAFSYEDGAQVSGRTTESIAVIDTDVVQGMVRKQQASKKDINKVIKVAKSKDFSNDAIRQYLLKEGFSEDQINEAMAPYEYKDKVMSDFNKNFDKLIKEGATEDNAFNEAIDNVVLKVEDDIVREEIIRELKKEYGKKVKAAPKAEKITGKAKPITIITDDAKGLTDIIKREIKAAKDKKNQVDAVLSSIAAQVKDMVTKGQISVRQMSAIINALKNTNLDNQVMVDRYVDYVSRVISRADFIERVNKGMNFKKAIKRNLKGKANPFVAVAKSFTELNPKWVVDIDKYNEIAELVFNSVKPTRISKGEVSFKTEADINLIGKYIAEEQANHLKIKEENLRALYEKATGEKSEGKSVSDMLDELRSDKVKTDYTDKIKAALKEKIKQYEELVTENDPKEVKQAIKIDVDLIDAKLAIGILDALDTYFANDSNASLKALMATYKGIVMAKNFKLVAKPLRLIGSKKVGRAQSQEFTNINIVLKRMFRGQNAALSFMEAVGFSDIIQGSNRAERQAMDKQNEYSRMFNKVKNFNSAENIFERNVIAFIARRDINANAEESINKRIKLLKDSVDVLRKSGTSIEIAKADLYEKVLKKLGLYEEGATLESVRKKAESYNLSAVDFVTNMFSEIYDPLSDTALGVYNTLLENDINYTPDKYSTLDAKIGKDEFDLDSSGFMMFNSNFKVDENKASVLMSTNRPERLPKNMYVDLDFDSNMFRSYRLALNDMYTAEAIRQANAFINSDEFENIIPTAEDRAIVESAIKSYVITKKGKNYIEKSSISFMNSILDTIGGLGAARALGGFSQFLNQFGTAQVNTLINAGEYMRPFDLFDKDLANMIANSGLPISNVGVEAVTTIENADKELDKVKIAAGAMSAIDKYGLSYIKKSNEKLLKVVLSNPDRYARIQAFAAYYRKSMKAQGLKADFKAPMNEKAARYAQSMIDANMDVSDTAMRGKFFTDKESYKKIIKQVFFPFSTFSLNQRNRVWSDIAVLGNKLSSNEDKVTATRSLAAFSAEFVAYNAIRYGVGLLLIRAACAAMGLDDEEEKAIVDKYKTNLDKSIRSGAVTDILSPSPVFDEATLNAMNKLMLVTGIGAASEEEFQKYISEVNDKRAFQGKEPLTEEEIEDKKDKFFEDEQFQFYVDNEKSSGMLGIQYSKLSELYDILKARSTGYYTREKFAGGGVEEVKLSDDAKEKLDYIALLKLVGTTVGTREVDQIADKMFKIAKEKYSLTEKQNEKYEAVKKKYKVDPYKMSLITSSMKEETMLEEIEYIESTGGLTPKQSKEYAKLRAYGAIDGWGLDDIRKGKTTEQIIASRK